MRKILCLVVMMCLMVSGVTYATTFPETIADDAYSMQKLYKGGDYSVIKNISVGSTTTGSVGTDGASGVSNTDIYKLTVGEDTLVTFKLSPVVSLYKARLNISTLYFVDDVTGEKRHYAPRNIGEQVNYEHYLSYGHYVSSVYLHKGTYYFTVAGSGYSKPELASNYKKMLDYKLQVVGNPFNQDGNGDTSSKAPLMIQGSKIVDGTLNMVHNWGGDRFYKDTNDLIKIAPSDVDLQIKVKVDNIKALPLEVFRKEFKYNRNEGNALDKGSYKETGNYKANLSLSANLAGEVVRVNPGESTEMTKVIKASSENRSLSLSAGSITQYRLTITMTPLGGKTSPVTPTATENKIGNYLVSQTDQRDGQLIQVGTSLKMIGGSHTNNQVVNGRRDGNAVVTQEKMNFLNKRLDMSYTVYGHNYAYFTAGAQNIHTGLGATTHHSWSGSIVVTNGMKLYKSIIFTATTYEEYLCTGNYYGASDSTIVYQRKDRLSENAQKNIKENQPVYIGFGDNYGGANAVMVVHEIKMTDAKTGLNNTSN